MIFWRICHFVKTAKLLRPNSIQHLCTIFLQAFQNALKTSTNGNISLWKNCSHAWTGPKRSFKWCNKPVCFLLWDSNLDCVKKPLPQSEQNSLKSPVWRRMWDKRFRRLPNFFSHWKFKILFFNGKWMSHFEKMFQTNLVRNHWKHKIMVWLKYQ